MCCREVGDLILVVLQDTADLASILGVPQLEDVVDVGGRQGSENVGG